MARKKRRTTEELEALVKKVDGIKRTEGGSTITACHKAGIAPAQYYQTRGDMGRKKILSKRPYNKKPKFETITTEPPQKEKLMVVVGSISQVRALLAGEI